MLPQVLGFVMQMLLVMLRDPGNGVVAKFFTREVLEGKDNKLGWMQMTMGEIPSGETIAQSLGECPEFARNVNAQC